MSNLFVSTKGANVAATFQKPRLIFHFTIFSRGQLISRAVMAKNHEHNENTLDVK